MAENINFVNGKKHGEAGFSFIELMISIVVFLIFISAVYGLLRITNIQKSTVNSQTEVMTNLRLSLNTVGRDAVNAGLGYSRVGGNMPDNLTNLRMSLPVDPDFTQDSLTAVIAGNNINANNFLPAAQRTDVISFAFRDINFNNGNPITITNAAAFGANGVVLTTAPGEALAVNNLAAPFDLYLISDGSRTVVALATGRPDANTLRFETGSVADVLGINAPYNGAANVRSRLVNCADLPAVPPPTDCMNYPIPSPVFAYKIFWISYSVTADGTLMRTIYGNNTNATAAEQIQTQPLAYNIQNFQIRYLMRDGQSLEDPSNNGLNQNNLNRVVQVEVTMSSRIDVQENGTNIQKVVDLKSTFSTRNLNYN